MEKKAKLQLLNLGGFIQSVWLPAKHALDYANKRYAEAQENLSLGEPRPPVDIDSWERSGFYGQSAVWEAYFWLHFGIDLGYFPRREGEDLLRQAFPVSPISPFTPLYPALLQTLMTDDAVLQGTYVINNPFWWSADDKFFNTSLAQKLGVAVPKTVLLPQKSYPQDVDITSESLRNLEHPIEWDALLNYVGRPAILKPFLGGGWKHVYKVHNKEELLAAYDGTGPYCMVLQEFIEFQQYVRCFSFGKSDIMPVPYDARERRYLVEHEYLTPELGGRVVRDAQTLNRALGYEMNTVEFAIRDGIPYAIDFLNAAPDFERERITEFYFERVVDKMARLVIDRALRGTPADSWPRWEEMLGVGEAAGFVGAPRVRAAGAGAA